jgi:hypothetical protein
VSPSSTLLGTSSSCRRLAYGTWYVLAALFLLGQFAFLGWVGPGPIFVSWSALAVPTLAATLIWLRRSGFTPLGGHSSSVESLGWPWPPSPL